MCRVWRRFFIQRRFPSNMRRNTASCLRFRSVMYVCVHSLTAFRALLVLLASSRVIVAFLLRRRVIFNTPGRGPSDPRRGQSDPRHGPSDPRHGPSDPRHWPSGPRHWPGDLNPCPLAMAHARALPRLPQGNGNMGGGTSSFAPCRKGGRARHFIAQRIPAVRAAAR